jgi:hypothetical protein
MEDEQFLFPVVQSMYMSAEIRLALDTKFAHAYGLASSEGDVLRMMQISDEAWQEYLRLLKRVPTGEYDPITGKKFSDTATRSAMEMLYRHYFGTFPFPRSVVPVLDKAGLDYGIANMSLAFQLWQERVYNHRNIMGMVNYAKGLATRDEGQVVTEVPAIFLDDEGEVPDGR